MNAHPDVQRGHVLGAQAEVEPGEPADHTQGGPHRPLRVVRVRDRRAEEGHDSIAGKLLDHTALSFHRRYHFCEELVEQTDQRLGIRPLTDSGEAADVLEKDANLPSLARQRNTPAQNRFCHPARDEAAERILDLLSLLQSSCHLVERVGKKADLIFSGDLYAVAQVAPDNLLHAHNQGLDR